MPAVLVAPDRGRSWLVALWLLWAVGLVTFVASTVLVGRDERSVVLDTWLYSALALGAAVLAVLRPVLVERGRLLWSLNALAISVYAAGDILYSFYVVTLDPEPYPSVADALWLSYYVFAVVLPRRAPAHPRPGGQPQHRRRRRRRRARCGRRDGRLLLRHHPQRRGGDRPGDRGRPSAYPVGALVLLGTAGAALAVMGWRVGLQWWALVVGGLLFAAADTVYAYLTATSGYSDGGPLDTMWLVALGLQAAAAWLRPRYARHAGGGTVVMLVLPLAFAGAALGLLVLEHFQRLSLLALVLAAATVAAALLRITLTVDEVRQLAVTRVQALTDELTGLPNRRRLDQELRAAVGSGGGPVGLLMLDLDRFKDVNDALGHPSGDTLLVEVARRLQGHVTGRELVARLGGDEFAVLLPGTTADALLEARPRRRRPARPPGRPRPPQPRRVDERRRRRLPRPRRRRVAPHAGRGRRDVPGEEARHGGLAVRGVRRHRDPGAPARHRGVPRDVRRHRRHVHVPARRRPHDLAPGPPRRGPAVGAPAPGRGAAAGAAGDDRAHGAAARAHPERPRPGAGGRGGVGARRAPARGRRAAVRGGAARRPAARHRRHGPGPPRGPRRPAGPGVRGGHPRRGARAREPGPARRVEGRGPHRRHRARHGADVAGLPAPPAAELAHPGPELLLRARARPGRRRGGQGRGRAGPRARPHRARGRRRRPARPGPAHGLGVDAADGPAVADVLQPDDVLGVAAGTR